MTVSEIPEKTVDASDQPDKKKEAEQANKAETNADKHPRGVLWESENMGRPQHEAGLSLNAVAFMTTVDVSEPEGAAQENLERNANDADSEKEEGEVSEPGAQQGEHKWCKIFYEPTDRSMQNYYFMHFDTRETKYEEPIEPYWVWDALTNSLHACGLQQPSRNTSSSLPGHSPGTTPEMTTSQPAQPVYEGYNPKIHGSYDPNADYARFHEPQPEEGATVLGPGQSTAGDPDYSAIAAFNRASGGYQTADKSVARHDDYNKSGRQMNAFFDVDAAANSHEGRSLKDERRQNKLSKKEIKELSQKRREKKEKKRLDFYKS
ncbi:hypothetical protein LTR62_008496 [Meristemomyces frigidus]|uniref:WW domain-containing protein n=1 Tax=Meristemomyces frigidus TaxID=1508187 RepID=A0AAN7TMW2_9PEZI|nr:hypothetical protein LTR62_008496 [Meristemomyces frigidus]